ncbi:hypothetical protein PGT21_027915 [Puccinia graminis f. sp. tritici]|uniref:HAT C-terminal dimerisation domain-containing protein n=1 Tax=Puccinia graminis f. sp. tritici TaxID=56615 RepID=A0A5B0P7P3_PUCGR|nr:hypothetical protein PGT21_027915 [Puccinia graminis f. sp. tritici]
MEGNQGTGAHVIPKYLELKDQLSGKLDRSKGTDMLYPMYYSMLGRVEKYLAEAMDCETLKLATILHPCYRMHLFELVFGSDSDEVKECVKLLNFRFLEYKEKPVVSPTRLNDPEPDITVIGNSEADPSSLMARLASRMTRKPSTPYENEIETFLKADLIFTSKEIHDKSTPLRWWKANCTTYPSLSRMARAYLGCTGSSCAVERLFSAASDVCSSRRGGLLPSTMSRCVSSLMWLREKVPLTGDFEEAGKALSALQPVPKKKMVT